jgi:hypothetical protein
MHHDDGKLSDLTDAVIQKYLKENLHWKVQKVRINTQRPVKPQLD